MTFYSYIHRLSVPSPLGSKTRLRNTSVVRQVVFIVGKHRVYSRDVDSAKETTDRMRVTALNC